MPVGAMGCPGTRAEKSPKRWQVSVGYGQFDTDLVFTDGPELAIHQKLVTASVGYRFDERWTLQLSAGAVLDGDLEGGGRRYHFRAGPLVAVQGSAEWLGPNEHHLLLLTTLTLGGSFAETVEDAAGGDPAASFIALDLRASVNFGATLWEVWTPYLLARAFGGPVLWEQDGEDLTGSDKYHYQLGLGSAFALPAGLAVFVDWSALGERALAAGVSATF